VKLSHLNKSVPALIVRRQAMVSRTALASVWGLVGSLILSGTALAQAGGGTIGAQLGTMAQEGSTAAGTLSSTAMYGAALICFVGGVWALWQSRQPQNREGGRVAMGVAGLLLCGLFVTGGSWINKAAQSTTGSAATVTDQAAVVKFQ